MEKYRTLFVLGVVLGLSLVSAGQSQSLSSSSSDPFKLTAGSSFSASGSADTRRNASASIAATRSSVFEAEEIIRKNYGGGRTPSYETMTGSAISGALASLDPHSRFYGRAAWRELLDEEQSGYVGIGVSISTFEVGDTRETYVISTFAGSPAAKAGLRYGDRLVSTDGARIAGLTASEVREVLRGVENSSLILTVERAATLHTERFSLRRSRIEQPTVRDSYIIEDSVGYIDLSEGFSFTTYTEFDSALRKLKRLGATSLVLDLRGNPGGIVEQAVKVAERFLPAGTLILSQQGRTRQDDREWRSANRTPETMPVVLLVDRDTASASEIVAGALQDNDRALVVGEKTFGKGLVQSVISTPGQTGITLTAARYLTPSGRSIQRDYTSISRYEYFGGRTPADAIDRPYVEVKTNAGRRMVGGDGIHPDIESQSAIFSDIERRLSAPVFLFVRELLNARIDGTTPSVNRPVGRRLTRADLDIRAAVDAFGRFVEGRIAVPNASRKQLEEAIVREVARGSFPSPTADQLAVDLDPQIKKALGSVADAKRLLALASADAR